MLAYSPRVFLNFIRFTHALLARTELSPKLRELAILRVATLTSSEYEWAQHNKIGLEMGLRVDQIDNISNWKDSTNFSEEERAVLQYTDEITQNVTVSDKTFKTLQQYLNNRNIVELTLLVGCFGMVARFLVPLQIDVDAQPVGSAQELLGRKIPKT